MDGRRIYAWTSFARVAPFTGEMHEVGYVFTEGSTTPWSWASLPGLPRYFNDANPICLWGDEHRSFTTREMLRRRRSPWLTSERRSEPRKP